ncbi:hypothetical protein AAK894_06265 [Lachnospiraceae bacterium 46-61]
MIRKLFSTYHIFSDRLKNLIEIYDETLQFYAIFLCDNKHMESVAYWNCVCPTLDCVVEGKYKNIDNVILKKESIGDRFLFRIVFEKQEYFVFHLVLVENILRKEYIGLWFQEIEVV